MGYVCAGNSVWGRVKLELPLDTHGEGSWIHRFEFQRKGPGGNVNLGVLRVHMILRTMRLASPRE